jgi:hypothetical protein
MYNVNGKNRINTGREKFFMNNPVQDELNADHDDYCEWLVKHPESKLGFKEWIELVVSKDREIARLRKWLNDCEARNV